jgi:hypothetical protein
MDRISLDRIVQRAIDVATLKTRTYSEIAPDPRALVEAAIVVVAVAISAGIGAVSYGAGGLITGIILSLLGWVISSAIIYAVGTRVTGTPTTSGSIQSLLRTLGYASAPNIFSFLGFIWIVGGLILFLLSIWTLVTTIFAIRAALNMSLMRAVITGFLAMLAAAIVRILLGWILGVDIYFPI